MQRFLLVVVLGAIMLSIAYSYECTGKNEQYYNCSSPCRRNCTNIDQAPKSCSEPCVSGCFCKTGYLRRDDNECVKVWECLHVERKRTWEALPGTEA
ncbi:venom peptide CtAPI-like [Anopheles albimanus]|uniref:TIL domain-containing protein n=1 Tax=Anopheles albimanus TaxID=7167 RepID=A0A182F9R2_ANOAL|nr:venom peptide CtAPI-like [Anopheles albimanus]